MAINRVEIKNFLVFQGEFAVDFCPGVNVLIGGNGTGKTTLMKCLYASCKFSFLGYEPHNSQIKTLSHYFDAFERITSIGGKFKTIVGKNFTEFVVQNETTIGCTLTTQYKLATVYIPTREMLSHSKSFLALCSERIMPFDQTQIDILAKAELGETHEITPNAVKLLEKISIVIGGRVVYENDTFYIVSADRKIPFSFEASGYQKFGLLWKLLRNGLLESGNVLFWDEPESSLNPELIPVLVDILLELQRGGVQVFIATHSEILASYFDVLRKNDNNIMFYSLYKDGKYIKADKSERFDLLTPNTLTAEQVNLYEREIEKGLGNA